MIKIHTLAFNPFQVNCYILWDETNDCIVVDASCAEPRENEELATFLLERELNPVASVFTHCHVDHVAGAFFMKDRYGLDPVVHKAGLPILAHALRSAATFGMSFPEPPSPGRFIEEGDAITFGHSSLQVLYTPGHVNGSVCLYDVGSKILISGDVLFYQSIGRTDLPTGNFDTLITNIMEKLLVLPDDTRVFPGHGPETSIGFERQYNPFLG